MNLICYSRDYREDLIDAIQNKIKLHHFIDYIKSVYYTLLRLGGLHPLCGNGVTSTISVTSIPAP